LCSDDRVSLQRCIHCEIGQTQPKTVLAHPITLTDFGDPSPMLAETHPLGDSDLVCLGKYSAF